MASAPLAAILSFFIPGLGQFYDGHLLRSLAVFFGSIILSCVFVFLSLTSILAIPAVIPIIFWIWNIYDAYKLGKSA